MNREFESLTVVFFDAGNTTVYLDFERISRLAAGFGIDAAPASLEKAERESRMAVDHEHFTRPGEGRKSWKLYFDVMFRLAAEISGDKFEEVFEELSRAHLDRNLWSVVRPEVPEALERLKRAGLRLGVVSNSEGKIADLMAEVGLIGFWDVVIDSAVVGVAKPDRRIFEIALEKAGGVEPRAAIHVGDLYWNDVNGARSAGLTPVLIDPYDRPLPEPCLRIHTLADLPGLLGV